MNLGKRLICNQFGADGRILSRLSGCRACFSVEQDYDVLLQPNIKRKTEGQELITLLAIFFSVRPRLGTIYCLV